MVKLNEVGQTINSTNNVSGQLRVADANSGDSQESQPICSVFDAENVQVVLSGLSGNNFNTSTNVDTDGNFIINNVPEGQYQISYQIEAPDGTILTGPPSATVNVDSSGQMSVVYSLIDPYGLVTDSETNQPVSGVDMRLYWADTELNIQKGRTPNTQVTLPILDNFEPNQNRNPQLTNTAGEYAWMVYPDGDYYILASKEGYRDYSTLEAKPNAPANGTDSYIQDGIIHVGQTIVQFSFRMTKQNNEPPGGGGGGHGGGRRTPALSITTANLPDGTVGRSYSLTITATGGTAPYSWTATGLPEELTMDDNGIITGTPGTAGTYSVTIKVQDSAGGRDAANLTLIVNALPATIPEAQGSEHKKYIAGYPDGKFYPDKELTRAEIAAIFYRVLQLTKPEVINPGYSDLTKSYWGAEAITAVTQQGIMTGYPDGTFRQEQPITRAEMANIVAKVKHLQPSDADTFINTQNSWARGAINAVKNIGLIKGYPDGTFRPNAGVTRAEAVTIINRMMNRRPLTEIKLDWPDVAPDHWAYGEICEASADH